MAAPIMQSALAIVLYNRVTIRINVITYQPPLTFYYLHNCMLFLRNKLL